MKQQEYIKALRNHLKGKIPQTEIDEIITENSEHIETGVQSGKSEKEIISRLGSPKSVAQNYIAQNLITKVEESKGTGQKTTAVLKAIWAMMILTPLNFFILIGPGVVIFTLWVMGWTMSVSSLAASSIMGFAILISGDSTVAIDSMIQTSFWFGWIGWLGLSTLAIILMFYVSKWTLWGIVKFLKWNYEFVSQRSLN